MYYINVNIKKTKFQKKDSIKIIGYRKITTVLISKVGVNNNPEKYNIVATQFLKEIAIPKMENKIQFILIAGQIKATPQKTKSRIPF